MDHDRALFVFGSIPEGWDLDDPEERQHLLMAGEGGDGGAEEFPALMRATVLEQVAIGRPAAVWATAQRLLAAGQHREQIIAGLVMAFTTAIEQSFEEGEEGFDESRYVAAVEDCWSAAGLALDAAGLTFMLAADDPAVFRVPRPPLSELCQAAGLEVRGGYVAGSAAAWAVHEDQLLDARLADRLDEPEDRDDVRRLLALAADPSSWNNPKAFDVAIEVIADDDLARAVADELAPPDGPLDRPAPWPLPDRVEWLCHKAVSFLEHRGGEAGRCLDHALAWLSGAGPADDEATDEDRAGWLLQAFTDPPSLGRPRTPTGAVGLVQSGTISAYKNSADRG